MIDTNRRCINWLEHTSRSIRSSLPETAGCEEYVTERLTALLLERLPRETGRSVLELLPEAEEGAARPLRASERDEGDRSIGYSSFLERAEQALGCTELSSRLGSDELGRKRADALSRKLVESYLWAVAQELPPELKGAMIAHLPSDLRSRMNLYSAHSEQERVG